MNETAILSNANVMNPCRHAGLNSPCIIQWHTLRTPFRKLTTSYTTLDPHPQDWDASRRSGLNHAHFIDARMADVREMERWFGEDPVREGLLDQANLDRPERRATIAVSVRAISTCAVATLNWTGLRNVVTDVIIAVPAAHVEDFDPKAAFGVIATLSDRDKLNLEDKVVRTLKKNVGEPAVFRISLADGPDPTCRIVSELTITLGRAMIRREMRRDQARAVEPKAIKSAEPGGPERVLGLCHEWPRRINFFVEKRCGSGFSHELATALELVGYSVVPDPRFEGSDAHVWYASRNSDRLRELLHFIDAAVLTRPWARLIRTLKIPTSRRMRRFPSGFGRSGTCTATTRTGSTLRRSTTPNTFAGLGFGVRWRHSGDYRVGTYEFSITVPR